MIRVIPARQRYCTDKGWWKTCFLFSFDEYFDPGNTHFGALRVFNDDTIAPQQGFPLHEHRDAEIVTVPIQGAITHEDSMGNHGVVHAGEVQRMSAGTGVKHSEANHGNEPVHLYQIWFIPNEMGLTPSYEQQRFEPDAWHNSLCALAAGKGAAGAVTMHSDCTLYRGDFDQDYEIVYETAQERGIFIYVTSGSLQLPYGTLATHDQARITGVESMQMRALTDTSLILIDVPHQ